MGSYETSDVRRIPTYETRRRKRSKSKKKKRRRRRRSTIAAKARYLKLAKPSRNPFLTFVRRYRQKHGNWSVTKVAVEAARKWCSMTKPQRKRYLLEMSDEPRKKTTRDDGMTQGKRRRKGKKGKKGKGRRRRRRRHSTLRADGRKLGRTDSSSFSDALEEELDLVEAAKLEFRDY